MIAAGASAADPRRPFSMPLAPACAGAFLVLAQTNSPLSHWARTLRLRSSHALRTVPGGNVGHLGHREYHFAMGPRQLLKWILLPAGAPSGALLRALALGGMGRLQVQNLSRQAWPDLAECPGRPVRLEFVQVRHAPQERGPASPVRRRTGWVWEVGGQFEPLARSARRFKAPTARAGRPELGRSNSGRLVLGYGSPIRGRSRCQQVPVLTFTLRMMPAGKGVGLRGGLGIDLERIAG